MRRVTVTNPSSGPRGPMARSPSVFGNEIKSRRLRLKLSQKGLIEFLNGEICIESLRQVEQGKDLGPQSRVRLTLAAFLSHTHTTTINPDKSLTITEV